MTRKVVIITGGAGGIGQELVSAFLADEALVISVDKKPVLDVGEHALHKSLAIDLSKIASDQRYLSLSISEIRSLLPAGLEEMILINNAAVQRLGSVGDLTQFDWQESFNVNVSAPFFLTQGLTPELVKYSGSVLNVSSIHARLTKKEFACYAASKAALESLTRSLALEMSVNGITVNAVAPAAIATEMLLAGFNGDIEKIDAIARERSLGANRGVLLLIKRCVMCLPR